MTESVVGEQGDIARSGVGRFAFEVVEAVRVEEARVAHVQFAGEGVHLRGEKVAGLAVAVAAAEFAPDVDGDGFSGLVVALHECGVECFAQGNAVADLQADAVRAAEHGDGVGHVGELIEILAFRRCPIEQHHGRGDFGDAADLQAPR